MNGSRQETRTVLVDGHVHFYPCFALGPFLDGAAKNFAAARRDLGLPPGPDMLLLTETGRDHFFSELLDRAGAQETAGWRFTTTGEPISVRAHGPAGESLIFVAGSQIAARRGLEILALGSRQRFADGEDLLATLAAVQASGALAVIPWGFGKWWWRRGRQVAATLRHPEGQRPLLGDNGGRPALSFTPALLKRARRAGFVVVPGTDPLPFASEQGKPGRFGLALEVRPDPVQPATAVLDALRRGTVPMRAYGRREAFLRFMFLQVGMQVRKRLGGHS